MLENIFSAFRKSKQNLKICIRWELIAICVKSIFVTCQRKTKSLRWRHRLKDDVMNLKFFPRVSFMIRNIPAKFHHHSSSKTEVINTWWKTSPPWFCYTQKSLVLIGLKQSLEQWKYTQLFPKPLTRYG